MNSFPRNIPYVPTYQEHLNLINYLHLVGNFNLRDEVIYHLSKNNEQDQLQTIYLGQWVGCVRISRMYMLIKLCKRLGVYNV